jgi:hypothetical protein
MTAFDDREKAFEAKFHLDQEMAFKATARRDKLFGLWAAEKLGLDGDAALSYAKAVINAEFDNPDHDVGHKVIDDFAAAGIPIPEGEIRHQMVVCMELAKDQLLQEMAR